MGDCRYQIINKLRIKLFHISIDNLDLIFKFRQYFAKVLLSLTDEEKEMFENIIRRLQSKA